MSACQPHAQHLASLRRDWLPALQAVRPGVKHLRRFVSQQLVCAVPQFGHRLLLLQQYRRQFLVLRGRRRRRAGDLCVRGDTRHENLRVRRHHHYHHSKEHCGDRVCHCAQETPRGSFLFLGRWRTRDAGVLTEPCNVSCSCGGAEPLYEEPPCDGSSSSSLSRSIWQHGSSIPCRRLHFGHDGKPAHLTMNAS